MTHRVPTADVVAAARAQWRLRRADEVARSVRLWGRPAIVNQGRMIIRDRVQLYSTVATLELATGPDGTLTIGERSLVNYGTTISALECVTIGARCQIGTYCMILDNDFHYVDPERRLERPPSRPVTVGDNVWLGGRVIVMPGVTIGDDSAVAAGSVVTRDVPPRTLVAGVPAKPIRDL
jgi:maltose O-acetyltransferase